MALTTLLWYVFAGFLLGWISSILVEWLWFRNRRDRVDLTSLSSGPGAAQLFFDGQPSSSPDTADREQAAHSSEPLVENRPDDLAAIRGIGEVYEQQLYQAGIFTWHQLSQADPKTLRHITRALPSSNPQSWIEQARELAREHGREDAVYEGPVPDDLTRIDGIDQEYEDELYAAGIFTFRHLAERAPDELARVVSAHLADDGIDFTAWIAQAASLHDVE